MSELTQDRKFIARILENLPDMPSDVKQGWIDSPKGLKKVLAEALCPPVAATETEFSVWKTIKLGTGLKTADDFRKAIKSADMFIGTGPATCSASPPSRQAKPKRKWTS